ncbi:proteasome assembly chaperone-like protein [Perilla frutescens var. frutescens]|nr:proteasome assembly chaperone-like protein [Perilla frutescens var. frutescens]
MEALDPAFPVRQTSLCLDINGHKTDIIISSYEDHIFVMATQIGSMGTILQARKEGGVSVDPTYTVSVVLGKRDEPMLVACARQLIEYISKSGSSKALVLSLGLRDHSLGILKSIVSAVTEKLTEGVSIAH